MKQLKCEMCGSTDLIKQDGVFVCQSCGIKYSVEEAKKMMVEGVVQVEGTVKIDNTDNAKRYKDMAIQAYGSGNTSEAYQYFLKVLELVPTDYLSTFYKGMCQGWETSLARPRVGEAVAAYHQAESYIPQEIAQTVKVTFIKELIRLMSAWFQKAQDNFFDVDDWYQSNMSIYYTYKEVAEQVIKYIDGFKNVVINSEFNEVLKDLGELYCSACEAVCTDAIIWTDYSKERAIFSGLSSQQKQPFLTDYDNMIFEVRKYDPSFRKPDSKYGVIDRMSPPTSIGAHNLQRTDTNYQMCLNADRAINQRVQRYKDEIVQRKKKERLDKYWSEHAVEKQQYEARLFAIDAEIKELRNQDAPYQAKIAEIRKDLSVRVPAESQLSELKKQQMDFTDQKSKLGLFAIKQKKELQTKIDSLQVQIDDMGITVKKQKSVVEDDVAKRIAVIEEERRPIANKLSALETEKNQITNELTRDR